MTTARDYARGVNPHHPAAYSSTRAQLTGLQPYSGSHMWEPYCIFEVGDKVRQQAFKSWALDNGIGFKELVGSYKGTVNAAFIALAGNMTAILRTGLLSKEESILYLEACYAPASMKPYSKRKAWLLYGRGDASTYADLLLVANLGGLGDMKSTYALHLGDWQEDGHDAAMAQEGWTFDPSTGKFYVCKE